MIQLSPAARRWKSHRPDSTCGCPRFWPPSSPATRRSVSSRSPPGMLADRRIVDADPLQNVRNLQQIAAVVANGELQDM
jgi:hypothetical protein